jgi:hypothetical protein
MPKPCLLMPLLGVEAPARYCIPDLPLPAWCQLLS